ncbi:MAG: hypothetical protein ACYTHM_10525 [Planctomycetota bacterium]|jgi:hypothetical protein
MDFDTFLGCILAALSLAFITYLTLWSRRMIHRIAEKGEGTFRKIVKDIRHGG